MSVNSLRTQAWAKKNPSRYKANQRATIFRYKESAINMYSNGDACCKWCGQADIDVLCLDHINNDGGGRNRKLLGSSLYRVLRKNDYPFGFQVLCANCNLKKEVLRRREIANA